MENKNRRKLNKLESERRVEGEERIDWRTTCAILLTWWPDWKRSNKCLLILVQLHSFQFSQSPILFSDLLSLSHSFSKELWINNYSLNWILLSFVLSLCFSRLVFQTFLVLWTSDSFCIFSRRKCSLKMTICLTVFWSSRFLFHYQQFHFLLVLSPYLSILSRLSPLTHSVSHFLWLFWIALSLTALILTKLRSFRRHIREGNEQKWGEKNEHGIAGTGS